MRFAIGMFAHETNTFCPGLTGIDAFYDRMWLTGDEVIAGHRGVRTELGGTIEVCDRLGIEIVPLVATWAEPSATVSRAAYDFIRDEFLTRLQAAGPIDALCLALHGAGSAEGIDDLEGTFLSEIRAAVGPDLPIVVALDLHGNTTQTMLDNADLLFYCHEYPHVDSYDRGVEIAELAIKIVKGELNPVMRLEILPAIIPPATTFSGPAHRVNQRCFEWERDEAVLDCNFTHGFPYSDVPVVHSSVLVTTDNQPALAEKVAKDISRFVRGMIEEFRVDLPGADEAIRQALAETALPVVIAEISDNTGGGAPGDGTHLLRALLAANEPKTAFGFIYDPAVAAQAHEAGVGATIEVKLGGFTDDLHGEPIEATAYVKCLTDGKFTYTTPVWAGMAGDHGKMARLVIGNVDVIVSSERSQTLDTEPFLLHGIDVATYRIVCLKSIQHFRAGFQDLAGVILRTDPPGATSSKLESFTYSRLTRPLWPFDPLPAGG
jgi:microcystin degradation protein MlrC